MSEAKKRGLGRGLSALLGEEDEDVAVAASGDDAAAAHPGPGGTTQHIAITDLKPSPFQPRSNFDDDAIDDLAASIREKGIIQPILVRASSTGETTYEIIAGERRWRAAQRAQLHEVPVLVREFDDRETAEIALIENLQRQDLSPLEEAEGYNRLMSEFSHTQEALGQALGKSRSHIANSLRLLSLPAPIKQMLSDKVLSSGHARALLGADNAVELAGQIVKKGLNVRQAEKLVKTDGGKTSRPKKSSGVASAEKDPDTVALERDLSNMLGLAVNIDFDGASGKISIRYDTLEQLDDILQRLTHGKASELGEDEVEASSADSDENEFDSMFIEDDDSDDEDLTAELETIADATLPEGEDDDFVIDGPEGDDPIESEEVSEDELDDLIAAEVTDGTGKKP
ncbi:ParB/RepB/Spo0J family partition protein [Thalassospira sp.]|uniref:ParB/RepB/Spo0J family partition protein n=1 Tax=Thalassospira sp. TaxID=1912094 RepID=UPI000C482C29|nr:ParB/RepB/Spo0J family partition protein [Thalassospira sp.]MBC08309.1 chromosome partitioning protein ParB [Thalassospira sp.]|tara:strand:- start:9910 stop:11106 length:1197 start_codon:yes stop_codon:yes gene_type:complete